MKNAFYHFLPAFLVVAALICALPAHSEPVTPQEIRTARNFVALQMHLTALPIPPYTQDPKEWAWAARHVQTGRTAAAAFYRGKLYLAPSFRHEWEMPYLVHEMTHWAQFLGTRAYPCHAAREKEAYQMQNAYAEKFGVDRAKVTDDFIERISACE